VTAGVTYDSMTDVPTLTSATAANYSVFNPLRLGGSAGATLTGANLDVSSANTGVNTFATIGITSGKWYWEVTVTRVATGSGSYPGIGVNTNLNLDPLTQSGSDAVGYMYLSTGNKYNSNSGTSYGSSLAANDVVGVALDMDSGTITFYKNNTSQGQAFSGITGTAVPVVISYGTTLANGSTCSANFGQRPFSYTPPTGFVALNTYNLPASTITNGAAYMNAVTYTGTAAVLDITTTNSPDFFWAKSRSNAYNHGLFDSQRGYELLSSNSTGAGAFSVDAYNLGDGSNRVTVANYSGTTDQSGYTYVGWYWKAGGSTGVSNTNGSITSTVSAGATQGFSVVTWTGTGSVGTIGHGLGSAPKFIISKSRSTAGTNWNTYSPTGVTNIVYLNSAVATTSQPNVWNSTAPTSSVFTVGTDTDSNGSGRTMVAYCWSEVAGYSAFGSFTGNGSTDGPFVYTSFRPRWIMWKNSSTGGTDWTIVDSSRNTYNVANSGLQPNGSYAEASNSNYQIDFLSNGFKIRTTNAEVNQSGISIIYACFAESPFKFANAR
jgi:hypothetical protein